MDYKLVMIVIITVVVVIIIILILIVILIIIIIITGWILKPEESSLRSPTRNPVRRFSTRPVVPVSGPFPAHPNAESPRKDSVTPSAPDNPSARDTLAKSPYGDLLCQTHAGD
jgi:hypothetical protein